MATPLIIPSRKDALRRMRDAGYRIAAVLPIYYPRALLRACGFHPVEVWGPARVDSRGGDLRFQAYTCAIVRNAVSLLSEGKLDPADVLLVPHTCDALQGMGSVLGGLRQAAPARAHAVPSTRRRAGGSQLSGRRAATAPARAVGARRPASRPTPTGTKPCVSRRTRMPRWPRCTGIGGACRSPTANSTRWSARASTCPRTSSRRWRARVARERATATARHPADALGHRLRADGGVRPDQLRGRPHCGR